MDLACPHVKVCKIINYLKLNKLVMDNSHIPTTIDLHNKNDISGKNLLIVKFQNMVQNVIMCGRYSNTKFANFLNIVLRAEIATIFEPKVVAISARNTMRKFANFVRLYFPHITTFFNQILEFDYF